MNLTIIRAQAKAVGIIGGIIPYKPVIADGDSSPYFGTYEGQRYGFFDTNCCWDFSAAELLETRLEMLHKLGLMPDEHWQWLVTNGYVDASGDIYLSRRWIAILSGVRSDGNNQINFWNLASVAGVIPNSMLPYTIAEGSKWLTRDNFDNDYFNPQVITKEMEQLGLEFLKRFSIDAEMLGGGYLDDISVSLQTYLKEGSLQLGIPVPQDGTWNRENVSDPHRFAADHAIELYKFDPADPYPYYIYDSYEPHLKRLSKDYFIPLITRVSVQPKPTPKPTTPAIGPTYWQKFWANVFAWVRGLQAPYPSVPIGNA